MDESNNGLIHFFKQVFTFAKEMFSSFSADRGTSLGASIAFYTIFSIAPILVIVIAVAGFFAGADAVRGELEYQLSQLIGPKVADMTNEIVENAYQSGDSIWATIIGILMLIIGSTTVVGEMKSSLNKVWRIEVKPKNSIINYIKNRILSFSFVLGLGFIFLVSLLASSLVVAFSDFIALRIPGLSESVLLAFTFLTALFITIFIFTLLFKYLPDAKVKWRHAWAGGIFTAILFAIGKYLIGFYLGNSSIATGFGTAGALVALLVWVYYTTQIVIIGAEFTEVWSRWFGDGIRPGREAVKVEVVVKEKLEK